MTAVFVSSAAQTDQDVKSAVRKVIFMAAQSPKAPFPSKENVFSQIPSNSGGGQASKNETPTP